MPGPVYSSGEASAVGVLSFGSEGDQEAQLRGPSFVAVDSNDNILVADTDNHRVQIFSPDGTFVRTFGSEGKGQGQFSSPSGLVCDTTGRIAVVDRDNNRIQLFDAQGVFLSAFGSEGSEAGQFNMPRDICIDRQGNFWVADFDNHRVQVFNSEGIFQRQVGKEGSGEGEFHGPSNIAHSEGGDIFVADMLNGRIQQLSSDGEFKSAIQGAKPDEPFMGTLGLSTLGDDELLVAETENHRVLALSMSKGVQKVYGGESKFELPAHAVMDGRGRLVVADMGNNRIQVLSA